MSRFAVAVVLVLIAAPVAATTLPVYRDPLGAPGLLSGFDLAASGPIVVLFDTTEDRADESLLLPERSDAIAPVERDGIQLATSCQVDGCFEGAAHELAPTGR